MVSKKIYEIEATQVYTPEDRQRQLFSPQEMIKLINSIKTIGQIQPGVCRKYNKKIEILVGERRLRACETIGIPFKFILKEDIQDPYILERVQLEENLIRANLTWQEEAYALEKIQKLLEKTEGFKTLKETSDYLGIGKTMLSEDISLASWIREVPEVAAAPNKTVAKKMVKSLATTYNRDVALEKTFKDIKEKTLKILKPLPPEEEQKLSLEQREERECKIQEITQSDLSFQDEKLLEYDKRCILGKMEDKLLDFPDKYFNLVFFDPPWGVNYDKSQKGAEYQKKYEDSKRRFLKEFPSRLEMIYDKMAEDSHLYIFFGIVNHQFIYNTLEKVGFRTSRIPLLWYKKGAHRTRTPDYTYGRSYEAIAFARKGLKKLQGSPIGDIITTPQPTPTIKDIHPSAKHPEIYKILLSKSGYPGDKVLDPMAGSGMMGVAAEELRITHNLDWAQIELDSDYRNLQIFNLSKGYEHFAFNLDKGLTSENSKEDFRKIEIGSQTWRDFWKNNPNQQDDMLKWKTEQQ